MGIQKLGRSGARRSTFAVVIPCDFFSHLDSPLEKFMGLSLIGRCDGYAYHVLLPTKSRRRNVPRGDGSARARHALVAFSESVEQEIAGLNQILLKGERPVFGGSGEPARQG